MKIDEPDTPFAHSPLVSDSEDEKRHVITFFPEPSSSSSGDVDDNSPRDPEAHKAFISKRKAHYNEIKMARALKSDKLTEEAFSEAEVDA